MRFRAGKLAFTASVTEVHEEPSPHTGAPLKWLNAATMVLSTATSITTNSPVVSLPIWPILRNSAAMISRVMPTPMILPSAVFPEASVTPGIR